MISREPLTTTAAALGERLIGRLERREASVAVVGLGYVGLPLAIALAEGGFRIVGIDLDEPTVARVTSGSSHIPEVADDTLRRALADGRFAASTDWARLAGVDAAVLCVPTPFNANKEPDLGAVCAATRAIARHAQPGLLVALESTTYPGTTEEVVRPLLEEGSGLRVGRDLFLAYSPERVDPGNRRHGIRNTPKLVAGVTPACQAAAVALYAAAVERVVPVSSPRTAEMAKLLENIFRNVNIALVNELAMLCDRMGIDVWEVVEAAATKPFGFMSFRPGPGVGGHCIPVDPVYLAWKAREFDFFTHFITLASEVNANMPYFVAQKCARALGRQGRALAGAKLLVIGVTFKPGVPDTRNSSALRLMEILGAEGADVSYHDPFVASLTTRAGTLQSVPLTPAALAAVDCVVIHTDHGGIDWRAVVGAARLVLDTRNATDGIESPDGVVVRL